MAVATVIAKTRIWLPSEVEVFNNSTIDRLQKLGYEVYAITVEGISAGSDGAISFNDVTTVLDGTGTADTIYIESADALDDTGATDCVQEVIINMVNTDGDPYRKTVATTGLTGTLVDEAVVRLYNFYSTAWGSGDGGSHESEGDITLGDTAGPANVFITITANDNESDGARIWVPDGYKSIIERVTIALQDKDVAAAGNGCWVQIDKVGFETALNTAPDASQSVVVSLHQAGMIDIKPQDYPDTGTTAAYYLLKESLLEGAETTKIYIMFILYKAARAGL